MRLTLDQTNDNSVTGAINNNKFLRHKKDETNFRPNE